MTKRRPHDVETSYTKDLHEVVMGRCRYLKSVSVFSVFFPYFFKVGSVFGIGISKYRDIGIGIRYFPRLYYFKSVHSLSIFCM